ncbi:MarC family protein [Silicimonas sp. MF1-12-2]|uniref:MarC family protein n=1 Tax=Silicimonas sp. MF1-12-2 TaxID=3384793 RepID=UPI0039B364E0
MTPELAPYVTAFVTLVVIIDPVGLVPLFAALTQGQDASHRRGIALRACLTAAFLLTIFGLLGDAVLNFVGISMPAFRIAGGILLFLTALDMLFERRTKRREDKTHVHEQDPSVFPLAIPLIAGPGAIATMILLAGQEGADWSWIVAVHGVMLGVLVLTFLMFLTAGPLERLLGPTGINVVTRLLGMLLAALSVQFVLDGLADFGFAGA